MGVNPLEYRTLGRSGLKVPLLSLGTATFGGGEGFFKEWGELQVPEATAMVDQCLEAGINLFDSADMYSQGLSEEILGRAIAGKQGRVLISTKASFRTQEGPNGLGSSRFHLIRSCEAQLKRLGVETIDIYQMHGFDVVTPVEEVLRTLEHLISSGKVRYIGCSNFSGWHLMKSLAVADRLGLERYVAQQVYYSLLGRDYEHELMPLGLDQGIGALVWSPLGWGRLTGKIRRGMPLPLKSRLHKTGDMGPPVPDDLLFGVVDVLLEIAQETGRLVPQVAINWLMHQPTVSSIIIGARHAEQLRQNLGALGWSLSPEQRARLDQVSARVLPYPYWHQQPFRRAREETH